MLRQIVFIYRDAFVCSLVEKNMKKEGVLCYATADLSENISYILDDLAPELVVVDEIALSAQGSQVKASLRESKSSFKTVLLSEASEPSEEFDFKIHLPFDPMRLLERLRSFIS